MNSIYANYGWVGIRVIFHLFLILAALYLVYLFIDEALAIYLSVFFVFFMYPFLGFVQLRSPLLVFDTEHLIYNDFFSGIKRIKYCDIESCTIKRRSVVIFSKRITVIKTDIEPGVLKINFIGMRREEIEKAMDRIQSLGFLVGNK